MTIADELDWRLQSIEDKLNNIESEVESKNRSSNSFGLFPYIVGGLIGIFIFVGDIGFHIPAHKPIKQESEVLSQNEKRYYIIYNENFVGSAVFNSDQRMVRFELTNTSQDPYRFDQAEISLWTNNHFGFGLQMVSFENPDWDERSLILNPKETVNIQATTSRSIPELKDVQGFSIRLKGGLFGGDKIRFGYKKLSLLDRLMWFIAEQIRKD